MAPTMRTIVGDPMRILVARGSGSLGWELVPTVMAAEVRKGASVLALRDAAGILVWAGWRQGR